MQAEPIVSGYNFSVEMERKYHSHLNLCVTNFSIAVIKYDDQSNLQEQEFICTYGSKELGSIMSGRNASRKSWQLKLQVEILHIEWKRGQGRDWKLRVENGLKFSKSASASLSPARLHLLNLHKQWP